MTEQERAAMQQALEALELMVVDVKTTPTAYEAQRQAIAALRAALAEPVQEPVQEPVHQFRLMYSSDWHDGHPNPAYGYGPYQTRTLYAAPPQRPRLTDEEIDALPWNGSPRQFARAIERKVRGE
jgi:hypothetical protein